MERLKRLRTEKGLSQARLAARAELDPSTVNQIERGAREASPSTLRKLADALEVSLYELMEEEAPKAPGPVLQLELEEQRGADEEQRRLSEILDTLIGGMRRLCDNYGPHIRLLSTGPASANTSPDDPPPKRLSETFAQLKRFRTTCEYVESIVDGLASSETVSTWLSRMNDPAIPNDIRRKLHDFENVREELFDNLETFARVWMDANREYLSDEERAALSAEFGYSPEEREGLAAKDV